MREKQSPVNARSPRGSPGPVGVKICGLMRAADAEFSDRAGAAYVGVVLAEGFSRTVTRSAALEVLENVENAVRVTVRVNDAYDRIMADAEAIGAGVVQLHGDESPGEAARIGEGGVRVWKAVQVRSVDDVTNAVGRYSGAVDALLLDGWHPQAVGGTGSRFSWGDVGAVRSQIPEDLMLVAAGGLQSTNVGEAVRLLQPDVVDVSSGVEAEQGRKDVERIRAFIEAVRREETRS